MWKQRYTVSTRVLIDTGASHNFIEVNEAKRLGLQLKEEQGWIKVVNTEARLIYGVARDVRLHIGDWVRAFPIPFAETMCIMGEGSARMVPLAREALLKSKILSAMQLSKEETSAKVPAAILIKSPGAFQVGKWVACRHGQGGQKDEEVGGARTGKRKLLIPSQKIEGTTRGGGTTRVMDPVEGRQTLQGRVLMAYLATFVGKASKCRTGRGI
ncbi:hypothetical protein Acr_01g0014010 [Actinidia rufa]|uniref:Uncharacterized protein n=1 Tax=Actinidia rufa TaxID=165716 RepID=A0A7J0E5P8_9ERIC|nr:hypothetical protein Acr_01g0014010 [Actinidia rufa]